MILKYFKQKFVKTNKKLPNVIQKPSKLFKKSSESVKSVQLHHGLLIFEPGSGIVRHNLPAISDGSRRSQHAVLLRRPLVMQPNVTSCLPLHRSSRHNGSFLQPSRPHKLTSSRHIAGLAVLSHGRQAGCSSNQHVPVVDESAVWVNFEILIVLDWGSNW